MQFIKIITSTHLGEDVCGRLTQVCVRLLAGPLTVSPGQRRTRWRRDRAASLSCELL